MEKNAHCVEDNCAKPQKTQFKLLNLCRDQMLLEPIFAKSEKIRLGQDFVDNDINFSQHKYGKIIDMGFHAGEEIVFPGRKPKVGDVLIINMFEAEIVTLQNEQFYLIQDYHFMGWIDDRDEFFSKIA